MNGLHLHLSFIQGKRMKIGSHATGVGLVKFAPILIDENASYRFLLLSLTVGKKRRCHTFLNRGNV